MLLIHKFIIFLLEIFPHSYLLLHHRTRLVFPFQILPSIANSPFSIISSLYQGLIQWHSRLSCHLQYWHLLWASVWVPVLLHFWPSYLIICFRNHQIITWVVGPLHETEKEQTCFSKDKNAFEHSGTGVRRTLSPVFKSSSYASKNVLGIAMSLSNGSVFLWNAEELVYFWCI